MRRTTLNTLLIALMLALLSASVVTAQDKTLRWNRYDVNIAVQPNGDFTVEETEEIAFTSGSFHFGYRAIPLDRVESLSDIQIFERRGDRLIEYKQSNSEDEYTFTVSTNSDNEQVIYWYFPYTENSVHTYVIRYVVKGGLRIYDGGDQLWWKAVPPDRNFPVLASQVKVTLPGSFTADQLKIESYGTEAQSYIANGSTVIFTADNISGGDELEVRVQFPHGVVHAQPPAWQAADDARRAAQEKWGPVFDVGFLFLGVLLLFGGPLLLYLLWYLRGKDASPGIVAEYITEPPDDLPPGVVGTLVDEKADMEDILATLVDLARRGAIHIEEVNNPGFFGIGSGRDFVYYLKDASIATKPYEKKLLQKIFGSREKRKLSDLKQQFYTVVPVLKKQLYDDVVQYGFFPRSPETTRKLYMGLGVAVLVFSVIIGFVLLALTGEYSGMAICPTISMILTAIGLVIVGRHMPRKTKAGAEAAARWLAFKRYLKNIEKYGGLETAKEQFDKYLPYAIAFGIEKTYMRQFEKVGDMPAPMWYGPPIWLGGGHGHYGSATAGTFGGGQSAPGPLAGSGSKPPSLSDASRSMGTSLSAMSAGLGSMLSSASRTFTSTPPSSSGGGGGFSGGGFSGGGGGGGGSAGFG